MKVTTLRNRRLGNRTFPVGKRSPTATAGTPCTDNASHNNTCNDPLLALSQAWYQESDSRRAAAGCPGGRLHQLTHSPSERPARCSPVAGHFATSARVRGGFGRPCAHQTAPWPVFTGSLENARCRAVWGALGADKSWAEEGSCYWGVDAHAHRRVPTSWLQILTQSWHTVVLLIHTLWHWYLVIEALWRFTFSMIMTHICVCL